MADIIYNTLSVEIKAGNYGFSASGRTIKFAGFSVIYKEQDKDKEGTQSKIPALQEGEELELKQLDKFQHFTQPPARFTEASLIKALEENGIGRPSTYAPTISTIITREYVEHEGKALKPTGLGEGINDLLAEYFGGIINENFTANMESELDRISLGDLNMNVVLQEFYKDFAVALDFAELHMNRDKIVIPEEQVDEVCDVCGAKMLLKFGRFGKFLSCERYPECTNKKKFVKPTGGICSKCGGNILAKKSKTGKTYYGCENNPTCGFMTWNQPITDPCPKCNATLFRTKGKRGTVLCLAEGCGYKK
jgi:DNA topoisomerase-1